MLRSKKGIAGFYLDIPALLAIIIGLSIFTVSLYHAQSIYIQEKQKDDMKENLKKFLSNFRNYQNIAESPGVFKAANLQSLNESILNKTYSPETLHFNYKIIITDNSGYETDYSCEFKTEKPPSNKNIYSICSSIIIKDDLNRKHLSSLKISIWRDN